MELPAKVDEVFRVLLEQDTSSDKVTILKIAELRPGSYDLSANEEDDLEIILEHGLLRLMRGVAAKLDHEMYAGYFATAVKFGQYEMAEWMWGNITFEGDSEGETAIEPVYRVLDRGFTEGWLTMEMIHWLESHIDIAVALELAGDAENRHAGVSFPFDYQEVLEEWLQYLNRDDFDREVARWLVGYFGVAKWYLSRHFYDPERVILDFLIKEKFLDPASDAFFEATSHKVAKIVEKILQQELYGNLEYRKPLAMLDLSIAKGKWDTKMAGMSPEKQFLVEMAKKMTRAKN